MNIFKIVFRQLIGNKNRTILSLLIVVLLASLTLFAIPDLNIVYRKKLKGIERLPKNYLILDNGIFLENEEYLKENYDVSFYQPNFKAIGQSINVALVSDNFFNHGIPHSYELFSSYKNIHEIDVLYGDFSRKDDEGEKLVNTIVIDETTSLKRFKKKNSIGRTLIINVDGTDVDFKVIAVIKETPVRESYIKNNDNLNAGEITDQIGHSQAFVFESDIKQLSGNVSNFSLAQIRENDELKKEAITTILEEINIDYKEKYYSVANYFLYEEMIKSDYYNSILSNIVIVTIVFIAFIVIFLINLMYGLKKHKEEISYFKSIGVAKETQIKIVVLQWIILIITGIIIGVLFSASFLFNKHKGTIFRNVKVYSVVLFSLTTGLLLLTTGIIIPIVLKFIKKTPKTLFRMDEEI